MKCQTHINKISFKDFILQRFSRDNGDKSEWLLSGKVIGYGDQQQTSLSLYFHQDTRKGFWTKGTEIQFDLNAKVYKK